MCIRDSCTAIALVFCILSISSYATQKVLYIYPEVDKSVSAQLSSYQEMPTAFVISAPIRITGSLSLSAPYLMQRDEFYPFQLPRIESGETDLDAIFAEEQQDVYKRQSLWCLQSLSYLS